MAANPAVIPHYRAAIASSQDDRRILVTTETGDEAWRHALALSAALIAQGNDIVLASLGTLPNRQQRRDAAAIGGLSLHSSAQRPASAAAGWSGDLRAAGEWLLDLAASVQPDVVHLNHFGHGSLAWKCPLVIGTQACSRLWWDAVHRAPPPPSWRGHTECIEADLKAADMVVAPTAATLRALRRHFGVLGATRVIPNGLAARNSEHGRKDRYVLSVGSIDDAGKNMVALAAAGEQLQWPVCIADPAPAATSQERFNRVCLLGQLNAAQLRRWIDLASIYAQPSFCEPYGMSILEAAASGCALVLGDIPSLRELWDGAALFVDPDDHAALAQAIAGLIDDPIRRGNFGIRARIRSQRHSASEMARAYSSLYAELAWRQPQLGSVVIEQRVSH